MKVGRDAVRDRSWLTRIDWQGSETGHAQLYAHQGISRPNTVSLSRCVSSPILIASIGSSHRGDLMINGRVRIRATSFSLSGSVPPNYMSVTKLSSSCLVHLDLGLGARVRTIYSRNEKVAGPPGKPRLSFQLEIHRALVCSEHDDRDIRAQLGGLDCAGRRTGLGRATYRRTSVLPCRARSLRMLSAVRDRTWCRSTSCRSVTGHADVRGTSNWHDDVWDIYAHTSIQVGRLKRWSG
ncbi:hypothetical protein LXA43DRAFT_461530 [Ganoderma leucocontextum]|nr:hypothetical protein LXA43DRAFT_461530 [Ganoderma leucocontextum]